MSERLTKLEFRIMLTFVYSLRGTCDRLRTATTLWTPEPENRIISGGYNGAPSVHPACDDEGVGHLMVENHCIRTNHGEENALLNCHSLDRLMGGTATILGTPCYPCARKLVSVGIAKVEYIGSYKNAQGVDYLEALFERANITKLHINPTELVLIMIKSIEFAKGPGGPLASFSGLELIGFHWRQ